MATKKITIADQYAEVEKFLRENGKIAMADFINERAELHSKRNGSKSSKPTKTQQANATLLASIVDEMTRGVRYTITDMQNDLPCCEGLTNQKVSAVIRPYVENGKISSEEIKGRKYFYLA